MLSVSWLEKITVTVNWKLIVALSYFLFLQIVAAYASKESTKDAILDMLGWKTDHLNPSKSDGSMIYSPKERGKFDPELMGMARPLRRLSLSLLVEVLQSSLHTNSQPRLSIHSGNPVVVFGRHEPHSLIIWYLDHLMDLPKHESRGGALIAEWKRQGSFQSSQ